MMNKNEFEARVREKAALEAVKIKKRNRVIRTTTAIAGTIATAACILLVMTKVSSISDQFGAPGSMNNSSDVNGGNIKVELDDYCDSVISSGNSQDSVPEEAPDKGVDSEEINKNEAVVEGSKDELFPEINTAPDSIQVFTYPSLNGVDGNKLSSESVESVMEWLCSLKLKDTGKTNNDKNGLLYEFELNYQDVVRTIYVFDNMIKVDSGTWFEFTGRNLKEFEKLMDNIRE